MRNALHRLPNAVWNYKELRRPLLTWDGIFLLTVNTGNLFSKLFHITRRLRLVFQLNDCVFPKDLTQYLSGYNQLIERTDPSR